jgi:hypothetical protein
MRSIGLEERFLNFISIATKIMFFLFIVGILNDKIFFLLEINFIIKIIIASYLVYRFNSYNDDKLKFTEFDRKLVYSSGLYILFLSFTDILVLYTTKIRNIITYYTMPAIAPFKSFVNDNLQYYVL